jgi:vacuolar-type H+-ATPase subunit F/Vma7
VATAAAIGEALAVEGYALAGAVVYPADSPDEAIAAFDALAPGTALVIVTVSAAIWLADRLGQRPDILTVVMEP